MSYAIVSVYDKSNIEKFARFIQEEMGLKIISTGSTAAFLQEKGIDVIPVNKITDFPEIMDGRVKTLHPKIFGGILARRGIDDTIMQELAIPDIKMVVVNLYPFRQKLQENLSEEEMIEFIDIGGPSLLRAAAKNYKDIIVVNNISLYNDIIVEWQEKKEISIDTRKKLAFDVFADISEYDASIAQYLYPEQFISFNGEKKMDMRYGENPHQKASLYTYKNDLYGINDIEQLQGKPLSYNNLLDMDAAVKIAAFFKSPCVAIIKHQNPCGVGTAETIDDAYELAYMSDPVSAFGGIIALNRTVNEEIADRIVSNFVEVVVAPNFSDDALKILSKKKKMRVIKWDIYKIERIREFKYIPGGILVQDDDYIRDNRDEWKVVTDREPNNREWESLIFGWNIARFVKSNAIVITTDRRTVGIGAGQMSRIDAVELAIKKALGSGASLYGTTLASDAFFPFRDSIDKAAEMGITAIIQPGGSIRDKEVIKACNDLGVAMVLTGRRHFRH